MTSAGKTEHAAREGKISSSGSNRLEMFVKLHCLLHKKNVSENSLPTYLHTPLYIYSHGKLSENIKNN